MGRNIGILAASLILGTSAWAQSYYCEAQGVYSMCTTTNRIEQCQDRTANGAGLSPDRSTAETDAVGMCAEHMTKMIIMGNTGSTVYKLQRAYVTTDCAVLRCRTEEAAQAPDPQSYGSDAEAALAEGDRLFNAGDMDGAIQRWEDLIAANPSLPDPYARLAYVKIINMDFAGGCKDVLRGLQSASQSDALLLGRIECLIYAKDPASAEQYAGQLMQSTQDADARLAANLLGWISTSLSQNAVAPCPRLAEAFSQRSQLPGWNLSAMSAFLATYGSSVDAQILQGLSGMQDASTAASTFGQLCGR